MEDSPVTAPDVAIPPRYQGVGGWLLLFCLGLTIFTPLLTLVMLAVSFNSASSLAGQYPGLMRVTLADSVLSAGLCAFSIYAGVQLWKIRPNAVRTAKRYLLASLLYSFVAAALPFFAGLPSMADDELAGQAVMTVVRGLLYYGVWYSYLERSKRVEATYASSG